MLLRYTLQQAAGSAIFTFIVALIGTIIAHYQLRRNVAGPLKTVSLELAAEFDSRRGDYRKGDDTETVSLADAMENLVYAPPSLKPSQDERGPMPYRRSNDDESPGSETAVDDVASVDVYSVEQSFHTAKGDATEGRTDEEAPELLTDERDK